MEGVRACNAPGRAFRCPGGEVQDLMSLEDFSGYSALLDSACAVVDGDGDGGD